MKTSAKLSVQDLTIAEVEIDTASGECQFRNCTVDMHRPLPLRKLRPCGNRMLYPAFFPSFPIQVMPD